MFQPEERGNVWTFFVQFVRSFIGNSYFGRSKRVNGDFSISSTIAIEYKMIAVERI